MALDARNLSAVIASCRLFGHWASRSRYIWSPLLPITHWYISILTYRPWTCEKKLWLGYYKLSIVIANLYVVNLISLNKPLHISVMFLLIIQFCIKHSNFKVVPVPWGHNFTDLNKKKVVILRVSRYEKYFIIVHIRAKKTYLYLDVAYLVSLHGCGLVCFDIDSREFMSSIAAIFMIIMKWN